MRVLTKLLLVLRAVYYREADQVAGLGKGVENRQWAWPSFAFNKVFEALLTYGILLLSQCGNKYHSYSIF